MRVFAQDTLGNSSPTYTQATFTNPQAAIPTSFSVMAITNGVIVTITPDSEEGLALQAVWNWIVSIRTASNTANVNVSAAKSYPDILTILNEYKTTLSSF